MVLSWLILHHGTVFTDELDNRVRAMVFNATFKNISAISWQSVLLRDETGVPGENH